jgi:hypothetical protein
MKFTFIDSVVMDAFVCLYLPEQFFSYLVAVTITGGRAAKLDLCLTLMAFSSEGSFSCQHLLRQGASVYTVSSEGLAPTSHSGVRTGDAKITRSLRLRFNHCATPVASYGCNNRFRLLASHTKGHVGLGSNPVVSKLRL